MLQNTQNQMDIEARGDRRRRRPRRSRPRRPPPPVAEETRYFSDSEDQSWHSPPNSIPGDECTLSEASVFSDRSSEVDLEVGASELKVCLAEVERDCRICKLSLEGSAQESGDPIVLGCSCKGDLGTAHKQCAETWFKTKGNTTCEICGGTAVNVAGEQITEANNVTSESVAIPAEPANPTEAHSFWHGRRIMNFLLACMVFAFIISWLFHFHVFS
ncbi:uncharacterized protein LOC131149235 [Malania oleifera]|uniref:uncharacterized protein LOC131149235 n=1 Tax=Malania oleifera TaxID=397392 RepID=UPI0025ADCE5F|nr:uncharacterized protein LOC131149235 [Malania oleifera]